VRLGGCCGFRLAGGEHAPKARPSVVLDNCGHWIQQEHPEEVNSLLLEFLSGL
jgi:pimeloyl-ACP methyl ester carboxylesterase